MGRLRLRYHSRRSGRRYDDKHEKNNNFTIVTNILEIVCLTKETMKGQSYRFQSLTLGKNVTDLDSRLHRQIVTNLKVSHCQHTFGYTGYPWNRPIRGNANVRFERAFANARICVQDFDFSRKKTMLWCF